MPPLAGLARACSQRRRCSGATSRSVASSPSERRRSPRSRSPRCSPPPTARRASVVNTASYRPADAARAGPRRPHGPSNALDLARGHRRRLDARSRGARRPRTSSEVVRNGDGQSPWHDPRRTSRCWKTVWHPIGGIETWTRRAASRRRPEDDGSRSSPSSSRRRLERSRRPAPTAIAEGTDRDRPRPGPTSPRWRRSPRTPVLKPSPCGSEAVRCSPKVPSASWRRRDRPRPARMLRRGGATLEQGC